MDSKTCTKCNIEKPLDEFKKQSSTKDGYSYACKVCLALVAKSYYKKNQEKLINKSVNWAKENPDKYKKYQKNYERKNTT